MFGRRIQIARILGFPIAIDPSFALVVLLVTWTLARGKFPADVPGLAPATYWLLGLAGAAGLFGSILLHELGHAVVARRCAMRIRGITLFVFGGVAELEDEPPSARAEFLVSIGGPIVSAIILVAALGLVLLGGTFGASPTLLAFGGYIAWSNGLLLAFNLIPAFPLDGGRVLRAVLWGWTGSLDRATRISASLGAAFGWLLIGLGVLTVLLTGNLLSGLWTAVVGMFLRGAAAMSWRQLLLRRALEGETIDRFMVADPISVPSSVSVQDLVDQYIYRYHYTVFPVVDGDRLVGCVSARQVRDLPRAEWARRSVGSVASACSAENTIPRATDAMTALSRLRTGTSRLFVVDGDRLLGIVSLRDVLRFLALKLELGEAA